MSPARHAGPSRQLRAAAFLRLLSPARRAGEHHPVLGRTVIRRHAPHGVEIDLEARVVARRRVEPLADAPVARPAVRHREAQVGRAVHPPAEQRQPVARLVPQALRGLTENMAPLPRSPGSSRAVRLAPHSR